MNKYEAPSMELEEIEMRGVLLLEDSGINLGEKDINWGNDPEPTQNSEV